jgi:hypothetical protein
MNRNVYLHSRFFFCTEMFSVLGHGQLYYGTTFFSGGRYHNPNKCRSCWQQTLKSIHFWGWKRKVVWSHTKDIRVLSNCKWYHLSINGRNVNLTQIWQFNYDTDECSADPVRLVSHHLWMLINLENECKDESENIDNPLPGRRFFIQVISAFYFMEYIYIYIYIMDNFRRGLCSCFGAKPA